MKKIILASSLLLMVLPVSAGVLSCDDLKAKIENKVTGKGVKNYDMTVVSKDTQMKGRVLGTCDRGTMKIIHAKSKAKAVE
ncbi:DUF1161 domain-containing protein [Undibacterium seohonense]|uniref:DUF1161 domain-containing protein n=1 Tax=Undibacterium seohonense TaxID=1344950 RepID=A0ABR6X7L8_9BURK|nr:DUF1161 domain-containing protein [Undibacterium seohonense]MBC3808351.1 DUF1161 domain-containing protein [Undibacterium seohonense]